MWEFLFSSLWGWIGVTGVVVIICGAVAWFVPPLRGYALMAAGTALALTGIYTKGHRDRAALEARRKEEAVRRAQAEYDKINKRPDTPADVEKRLSNGTF